MSTHVLHVITGLANGGAEGALYRLCSHDDQNLHTVISLMDMGKYGPLLLEKGITVHCIGLSRGKATLGGCLELLRLIKKHKPDIVQTWMYHADFLGGIAARLAGVPKVFWGIRFSNADRVKTSRSTLLLSRICSVLSHIIPTGIVSCARKAAEFHQGLGYSSRKIKGSSPNSGEYES